MTSDSLTLLGGGVLSFISITLGFVALLKQKTYINEETQKPTEVELPFWGKMKTNYPSLIFVFLGFAFAFYVVHTAQNATHVWHIEGRFTSDNPNQKWTPAYLVLEPRVEPTIKWNTGVFTINVEIPRGKTFEEVYSVIGYTDGNLSATIPVSQALEDYQTGGTKYIEIAKEFYRRYKPVKLRNQD